MDNTGDIRSTLAAKETCLPEYLRLKIGTPVMLLHNISVEDGWLNGTLATVTELNAKSVQIRKTTGETLLVHPITRTVYKSSVSQPQIPLDIAYATTIHKVQSLTLPSVAICMQTDFPSHGQFYVAVSRVTKVENLYFFPDVRHTTFKIRRNLDCAQAIENIEGSLSE